MIDPFHPGYRRLVRASAWYDLVVTAGFATPWTYTLLHGLLSALGEAAGVGGLPAQDPMQTLLANLMGSVVVVWSVVRIVRPLPELGLADAGARALFATWQAYALALGLSLVIVPLLAAEVLFGLAQVVPWLRRRTAAPA